MNLKNSMEFLKNPTPEMVQEIRRIDSHFNYWESRGFQVGWLSGNAAVLRWYASFVSSGRPRGNAGFLRGLRKSLKASIFVVVPRTVKTVTSINGYNIEVSDGSSRPKGSGLTFTLLDGKKITRFLNDHSRLNNLRYRYKLCGNDKIRKRGLRYLCRYEIEYPETPEFVSIDSFDSLEAFESFHYHNSSHSHYGLR